jgi:hypothetical protein
MSMELELPEEIVEALGPEPEREVLEGVLLLLVGEGRLTLERAGVFLGLGTREEAVRWYADRTSPRPDVRADDSAWIGEIVHLEDLTQDELDRSRRFLKIRPAARGSGLSDVSMNHDKYLAEDD